jgi:hypothetical protein
MAAETPAAKPAPIPTPTPASAPADQTTTQIITVPPNSSIIITEETGSNRRMEWATQDHSSTIIITGNSATKTVTAKTHNENNSPAPIAVSRHDFWIKGPHVRMGGVLGLSGGLTLTGGIYDYSMTSGFTSDFGRGGMRLAMGGYGPISGSRWPQEWDFLPIVGLRVAYLKGWNDRDESDLPRHIVGKLQTRGYWGAEGTLSLGWWGPAMEISAYRAVGSPSENIVAVGYGLGF